jgi:hypothetical protein
MKLMRKEVLVAHLEVLSRHFPERCEKNHEDRQSLQPVYDRFLTTGRNINANQSIGNFVVFVNEMNRTDFPFWEGSENAVQFILDLYPATNLRAWIYFEGALRKT